MNGSRIAKAIIQGNAIAVCDGLYKYQFGTAGFVIQCKNHKKFRVTGANVTPGYHSAINPYRAELGGISAIVVLAAAIATFHDIQTGTIELGCDCESGITAIFEHTYDTPKQPNHDLIHEIRKKLALSRVTRKCRDVSGHQDKHQSFDSLDLWGQLNVEMDGPAKAYWNDTSPSVAAFYPPSTSGWSLWINDQKLSSWNRTSLYNHAKATDILEHWSTRRYIPHNLIRSIDWEASARAIKLLGLNRDLWIPTWLAGFAPVGKVQQRNNFQDHAECPRCSSFENKAHVVICPAPNAQRQWAASLSRLATWLTKAHTLPDIRNAILLRLSAWHQGNDLLAPSYAWPGVNGIVLLQDSIGWRTFLEGSILHAWAAKQQDYYNWLQKRNTSKQWITTLIKKLWQISWNMWEHRNGELKNPASPASLREHARLDALISAEYTNPLPLYTKARRWFRRSQEIIFTESLDYKNQWLESVSLARARYARCHNTSTQAQCTLMQSTFRSRASLPRTPLVTSEESGSEG